MNIKTAKKLSSARAEKSNMGRKWQEVLHGRLLVKHIEIFLRKYTHTFSVAYILIMIIMAFMSLSDQSKLRETLSSLFLRDLVPAVTQKAGVTRNHAAAIIVAFEDGRFVTTEEKIVVSIIVETDIPLEMVSASLYFQHEYMELVGILKDDSVINEWFTEPSFSDIAHVITFAGIINEPTEDGAQKLLTLVFKPVKTGKALVDVIEAELISGGGVLVPFKTTGAMAYIRAPSLPSPDFNEDGVVDAKDITLFTSNWEGDNTTPYDLNQDGKINFLDLNILLSLYKN